MDEQQLNAIENSPNYQALVKKRTSFGWVLTIILMVFYYGYILLNAFDKPLMFTKLSDGITTFGLPLGIFIIVFSVILTGIYVFRANMSFDPLTESVRQEAGK